LKTTAQATATILAAAALATACGGSKGAGQGGGTNVLVDPAAAFAVRVDADLTNGRFDRAWRTLHPAQQKILSQTSLSNCWRKSGQTELERGLRFEARDVSDQKWPIAGVGGSARPAKAVRVRVLDGTTKKVLDTFTQHVFAVEGRWRWIVAPQIMRAYRSGACGPT
jgi:hypothetical protein